MLFTYNANLNYMILAWGTKCHKTELLQKRAVGHFTGSRQSLIHVQNHYLRE